jgi:hypothetical protein
LYRMCETGGYLVVNCAVEREWLFYMGLVCGRGGGRWGENGGLKKNSRKCEAVGGKVL